jgi:hypothetical protein
MAPNPDIEHFSRLIDTLRPWLDQVVIIGGWAHRLYRLHPLAQPLDYPVSRQNSMRTENSAIPSRDGCPIQVIP